VQARREGTQWGCSAGLRCKACMYTNEKTPCPGKPVLPTSTGHHVNHVYAVSQKGTPLQGLPLADILMRIPFDR
jgi:hypothetical protein